MAVAADPHEEGTAVEVMATVAEAVEKMAVTTMDHQHVLLDRRRVASGGEADHQAEVRAGASEETEEAEDSEVVLTEMNAPETVAATE